MTGDPNEAISFQYRIAELYEKHLDDVPRAIELYRDILQQQPDHEPTLARPRRPEGRATRTRSAPPRCSSRSTRRRATGRSSSRVHEVQVRAPDDAFQKVELLHRIARLYEDALDDHGVRVRYVRARAAARQRQRGDAREPRAPRDGREPLAATSPKLYDAELDKLTETTPSASSSSACASRRSSRCSSRTSTSAIARYRRVLEVDAENQTAIRALDRLFAQTERWADLAAILAREAEIGQTPDEILEFKYRLGQVRADAPRRPRRGDRARTATSSTRRPSTSDARGARGALRGGHEAGRDRRDPRAALPLDGRVGEARQRLRGAARATRKGEDDRLAAYYRLAELLEEKLLDAAGDARRLHPRAQGVPARREGRRRGRRASPAAVDGGWETLANAYADILGLHDEPDGPAHHRQAPRARRSKTSSATSPRPRRRTSTSSASSRSTSRRSRTSIASISSLESWPELAQILEMRVKADDRAASSSSSSTLASARSTRRASATLDERDPRVPPHLRRARQDARAARSQRSRASTSSKAAWHGARRRLRARARERRRATSAEAEIRAKIAHLARRQARHSRSARSRRGRPSSISAARTPRRSRALANLYERAGQWARARRHPRARSSTSRPSDDDRVNILTRRARIFSEQARARRLGARGLEPRPRHRLREPRGALRAIAAIRRRQGDPNELVNALHQLVDRAAALLDAEELKEIFRELGKTYGEQLAAAVRRRRRVAQAARGRPRLRGDGRPRGHLSRRGEVDRRHRRQDAARGARSRTPPSKIEEYRAGRRALARPGRRAGQAHAGVGEDPRDRPDARRGVRRAREAPHRRRAAGSRSSSSTSRASRRAKRRASKTELLRKIAQVFEEKLDDKNQALDALVNALGDGLPRPRDAPATSSAWRRPRAAGRRSSRPSNSWLKQQTEPRRRSALCLHLAKWYGDDLGHPEYAQPYYAQIVQLDPNNVGALRQMASSIKKSGELAAAWARR